MSSSFSSMFTTSTTDINVEHFANTGLTNEQFFDVCFTLADEINSYNPSTSIMSDDDKKINIDVLQKAWFHMRQIDGTPLIFRPDYYQQKHSYVRDSIDDLESIEIFKKDIFKIEGRKFVTGRAIKKENGFYKIRFDFGFIWGKVWKSEETDIYYLTPKCYVNSNECQEELQEEHEEGNKAAPVEELEAPQEELQEATSVEEHEEAAPVEELAEQEEDNDDYQLQMILQQLKKIKERKSDKDKKRKRVWKRVWQDLKLEMSKTEWFENGKTSANFQNVVFKKLNNKHKAFFSNGGINTIRKKIKDVDEDLVKCIAFDKYRNMMSEKILSVIKESETQSNKKKSSGYHKLLEVVDDLLEKPKRRRKR
jgi:hypothetical protein